MGAQAIFTGYLLVAAVSYGEGSMCGQSKPDHQKTCISVRLPWKAEPIYFCTEKENVKFERRCPEWQRCAQTQWSNNTLMIATPWDCCPIASKPSNCDNIVCPSKPFNRTCVTLSKTHSNGCCPMYFCEDDAVPGEATCNFKSLEPSCHKAPTDKANCVAFIDHYGCCTKYQCEGDGKPGTCPPYPALNYYANAAPVYQNGRQVIRSTNSVSSIFRTGKFAGNQRLELVRCIGDYNCPSDMKCCSSTYGIATQYQWTTYGRYNSSAGYYSSVATENDSDGDSNKIFYDPKATYGYCTHPIKSTTPRPATTTPTPTPAASGAVFA